MRLDVPGATLHYETRGSGPALLLVPGGPTDAHAFDGLAPLLAGTVITYDPRGLGRSTCEPGPITVHQQTEDALAVLDAVTGAPADVFAHSGGALTALGLVAKYPERLRTAVLLEPPLVGLLPEAGRMREETAEVLAAYQEGGIAAAGAVFARQSGLDGPEGPPDPGFMANLDVFFGRMYGPIGEFHADLDAVRAASTRVVVGVGATSKGEVAYRASVALAEKLGQEPVEFPGDHAGFGTDPHGTANVLRRLLS
jgi:pimeloyl-ACP methyl ester carboxylesterase